MKSRKGTYTCRGTQWVNSQRRESRGIRFIGRKGTCTCKGTQWANSQRRKGFRSGVNCEF